MNCPDHGKKSKLRMRRGVTGNVVVQRQCDFCYHGIGDSVELSAFPKGNFPSWLNRERPTRTKRDYKDHLKSAYWRALRLLVFERDGYLCQSCARNGLEVEATEVAHLTYDRFGHEEPDDVEASCKACNAIERTTRLGA